jgi:hypothetical protein
MLKNKSETYSVEGTNADLRHYLARLQRASRCFSRCFKALARAVELFVYFYIERRLKKSKLGNILLLWQKAYQRLFSHSRQKGFVFKCHLILPSLIHFD